jgi:hypothetical protein
MRAFASSLKVSDDLPNGSGRQLDQRRSRQDNDRSKRAVDPAAAGYFGFFYIFALPGDDLDQSEQFRFVWSVLRDVC